MEKEFLADPKVRLYRSGDHLSDWLTAIRSREQPICDVEIGASTANLCNLVNLAYYHGQPMKWDPARERFAGGTGDESGWMFRIASRGRWASERPPSVPGAACFGLNAWPRRGW